MNKDISFYTQNFFQDCDCIPYEQTITVNQLAAAYVPFQKLCTVYQPEEALIRGTMFPELSGLYNYDMRNKGGC